MTKSEIVHCIGGCGKTHPACYTNEFGHKFSVSSFICGECHERTCGDVFIHRVHGCKAEALVEDNDARLLRNAKVNDLHNKAMSIAEAAGMDKEPEKAFEEAMQIESLAAYMLVDALDEEPSRSVLFRSAAQLALDADLPVEALRLVETGLAGKPPAEIARELRDVERKARWAVACKPKNQGKK